MEGGGLRCARGGACLQSGSRGGFYGEFAATMVPNIESDYILLLGYSI